MYSVCKHFLYNKLFYFPMLDKFKENFKLKNREKIFTTIVYYKTIKTVLLSW